MKLRRAYIDQMLSPGVVIHLEGEQAHYLARVLRLRPGYIVELFNGDGQNYTAEIIACSKKAVDLKITGQTNGLPVSGLKINLIQALSRGERLDYSLQKATELGVSGIQLLYTERVELQFDTARLIRRMRHWQQVIISACEQSGRSELPQLLEPVFLAEYLQSVSDRTCLALDPLANQNLSEIQLKDNVVDVLVGPEGGFSESEIASMASNNVTAVRLGPRVLRTETAGPAVLAILQQLSGDFKD